MRPTALARRLLEPHDSPRWKDIVILCAFCAHKGVFVRSIRYRDGFTGSLADNMCVLARINESLSVTSRSCGLEGSIWGILEGWGHSSQCLALGLDEKNSIYPDNHLTNPINWWTLWRSDRASQILWDPSSVCVYWGVCFFASCKLRHQKAYFPNLSELLTLQT